MSTIRQWWGRKLAIQSEELARLERNRIEYEASQKHKFENVTAERLGIPWSEVKALDSSLAGWTSDYVLRILMSEIEKNRDQVVVEGYSPGATPRFHTFQVDGSKEEVLDSGSVFFPAGTLTDFPFVLRTAPDGYGNQIINFYSAGEHLPAVHEILTDLTNQVSGPNNPYRGRTLIAGGGRFAIVPHLTDQRSALSIDPAVEQAMDNIHTFFERHDLLAESGLSPNRGLLLYGPPGTGKSAVSQVLAAELAGKVTVILAHEGLDARSLPGLYKAAIDLSPALIVVEDLDRMQGLSSGGSALKSLLSVLSGAMTLHQGIATVASVNNVMALDKAAIRAGRFDEHVEMPFPDLEGRQLILTTYLDRMAAAGIDVSRINARQVSAAMGEGKSGADVKELLTRGVMTGQLTTSGLSQLAREMRQQSSHQLEVA